MPIKYISFIPEPVEGQAVLGNFNRILRYKGADELSMTLQRGMPLYEMEKQETVGENTDGNMVIRGECVSACAYLKEQGVQVDLVYIDPPFASGADYAKKAYIRRNPKVAEAIAQAERELDVDELKAFEEKMYGDVWDKEKYLTGKAEYCRERRLAYCLEEYAAYQLEAVYTAEHKECAHTFYGKLIVKLRLASEDAYYRHGSKLEKQECAYEHRFCNDKGYFQSFLYSVGLTAAVVEAEYGLCACGKTYYNGYHYLVDLHGDTHGGHGYLGTVYAHCAVLYQQVVGNCHYQHYGHLGDKA